MTTKEFYTNIINANLSAEMTGKALTLLASLEKKNSNRSAESKKRHDSNFALAQEICAAMTEGTTYAASELKTLMGREELTVSKISAVMAVAEESNLVSVDKEYKVGGKGRKVKGYALIVAADDDSGEESD